MEKKIPKSREQLYESYQGMIDGQMELILDTILNAVSNVMYFCTAGKDRTGVVSALLFKTSGSSGKYYFGRLYGIERESDRYAYCVCGKIRKRILTL